MDEVTSNKFKEVRRSVTQKIFRGKVGPILYHQLKSDFMELNASDENLIATTTSERD